LKDLVRQCVIIGKDKTEFYGGYSCQKVSQKETVYICDLAGLQFQTPYNSGRLVLIEKNPIKGFLDDYIFESVVKEKKATFEEMSENSDKSERYAKLNDCYFDIFAYKKFVINDVILTGKSLNDYVSVNKHEVNFKFLQYGTGYFAGSDSIRKVLKNNISDAVLDGFEALLSRNQLDYIKSMEFAFYDFNEEQKSRLLSLCDKYGKTYV
jgi:hypothetical protein